jgi:hypothetical protein
MFGLVYGSVCNYKPAIGLAQRHSNFSLLGNDQAVIGTRIGLWVPKSEVQGNNSVAVSIIKNEDRDTTQFTLGDFAKLGDFFAEVIGSEHQHIIADGK